jgi:hypothetical protein
LLFKYSNQHFNGYSNTFDEFIFKFTYPIQCKFNANMRITFFILLSFIHSFCFAQSKAQFADLHFTHLTMKDGLSSDLVLSVYQDYRGIMWICTEDAGFNRYDGNKIKVFKHIPGDSTSVPSNNIRFITEGT